ncbi:MAG: type II toxin-antitoxin system PemK/MazF family toxin [Cyanobacteria bacterium SBLK]|nr:type II toxin-antitoxin system PemK/MazF family toxin [Cyanobacteria bacterium SBLK]
MARGDVLLVSLPESDRREETGNRPAIAVQAAIPTSPMLMVVPLTSSMKALRFPFSVQIEPSDRNGLTVTSVAMVFHQTLFKAAENGKSSGKASGDRSFRDFIINQEHQRRTATHSS